MCGRNEYSPGRDGKEVVESFAVITTKPNEMTTKIHGCMPIILPGQAHAEWLDPENDNTGALQRLLVPFSAEEMRAYPVRTLVNNAKNKRPELVEPA